MSGLYHLGDASAADIETWVARAHELRAGAQPKRFPGRSLALLFMSPSLRTHTSFTRAAQRLGLELVSLAQASGLWQLEVRDAAVMDGDAAEHVRDAAAVIGRMVDVLGVRALGHDDVTDPWLGAFRRFAGVPVINMESSRWHPCQALADWTTLDAFDVPRSGKLVLRWAWHPRPLPRAVPNSVVTMAAQRGMETVISHPPGYGLRPEVLEEAQALAQRSAGSVRTSSDDADVAGAHVVYAKAWAGEEGQPPSPQLRDWCVDDDFMRTAANAHFFHCLPVRRNVVVTDSVLDGDRSRVLDQAENRLHAQTAFLEHLYSSLS